MALPTNFTHRARGVDAQGVLHIVLTWQSDTGSLTDLSDCMLRELVEYDRRGEPAFVPFAQHTTGRPVPGNFGTAPDIHVIPDICFPRQAGVMSGRQHYQYRSLQSNGDWVDLPGNYFRIYRELLTRPRHGGGSEWVYRFRKESITLGGFWYEYEIVLPG
ncbi:hypothetical protein AYO40_00935 [Planctomycetaceae bacterium SCGC AG-212-D15]|nr:hypothetical protein AYO40_00935 [Planctomycetaceae bacterium SCGC AG-212-D15]